MSRLPIHQIMKQIKLDELLLDFDAVSLNPSAMWNEKSICPRIESGCTFYIDKNDELVNKFNNQTFNQGSAILKIKIFNPENLIVQHLPVKERVNENEVNRMRNSYIIAL